MIEEKILCYIYTLKITLINIQDHLHGTYIDPVELNIYSDDITAQVQTNLDSCFRQVNPHCQFLSHIHVRVVSLSEGSLQCLQLTAGKCGPEPPGLAPLQQDFLSTFCATWEEPGQPAPEMRLFNRTSSVLSVPPGESQVSLLLKCASSTGVLLDALYAAWERA